MENPSPDRHLRRNPTFVTMVAFGLVGLLLLLSALGLYIYFEPVNQNTNTAVHVIGIKQYDPDTGTVTGRSKTQFKSDQIPAALIDWSGVSSGLTVEAGWYDQNLSDATSLHTVGPKPAGTMPRSIPLVTQRSQLSPGLYLFIVGRYSGGRIVEVLARQEAQVT